MLKHLLHQLSKVPEPWFSKKYLLGLSPQGFQDLLDKKILIYDKPAGIEMVYEPACPHGCSLAVEESPNGMVGICLDHPQVKAVRVTEDDLIRYKFSIGGLLNQIRSVNAIKGGVSKLEEGYYFGYSLYGDKRIGLVLFPHFGEDLIKIAGIDRILKDEDGVFILSPAVQENCQAAVYSGDRVVVLDIGEVLDLATFKLSLEPGIEKLQNRGILKDVRLEFPGIRMADENNEVRVNGKKVLLSDRPFLLLLRVAVGFAIKKDHCISLKELIDEKIIMEDGKYQAAGRLKGKMVPFLPGGDWDAFFENDKGMYRLSSNVKSVIFDRVKLVNDTSQRIKEVASKLPKMRSKSKK